MTSRSHASYLVLTVAALGFLSSLASGGQTVHLDIDFTDGNINNDIGTLDLAPGIGIQPASSWRSGYYLGPSPSTAFTSTWGFGDATLTPANLVGVAPGTAGVGQLATGNVWVFDMSMISDVAISTLGNQYQDRAPGFDVQYVDAGYNKGAIIKFQPEATRSVVAGAGPDAGDVTTEPNALPIGLGADMSAALNQVMHAKFVYQQARHGWFKYAELCHQD